jgi:hypothetical protein
MKNIGAKVLSSCPRSRGLDVDDLPREVEDKFISAFVRASKPAIALLRTRVPLLKNGFL